jgi:hypothetical protein
MSNDLIEKNQPDVENHARAMKVTEIGWNEE